VCKLGEGRRVGEEKMRRNTKKLVAEEERCGLI
jgi:hypothetical protein